VQPGFVGEAFERARERIWIDEKPVPPVAQEGDGSAELVERVTPGRAESASPVHLLASVPRASLQGEGGKLNDPT